MALQLVQRVLVLSCLFHWKGNVVGGRVAEVEKDMFDIHSGGVVARVKRIFCWFV